MKKFLALLAASSLAQDDTIIVSLTSSDEHVEKGGSVSFTCEWTLNADYKDYDEDNFQMYWKLEHTAGVQTIASWEPAADGEAEEPVYYLNHMLEQRVTVVPSFDDPTRESRNATMEVTNLDIDDDNMEISCEIHWGRRFEDGNAVINVYVNADEVDLQMISNELEGRAQDDNGTLIEPDMEQEIAECTIHNIYPQPEAVTFIVGDEQIEVTVEDDDIDLNDDDTFTVSAVLTLAPLGQYNGDVVSCEAVAAPDAEIVENAENSTFALEVFYYTNEVTLTIGGDAVALGEDDYSVIENHLYTVSCVANGNPAPEVVITNHEGQELVSGSSTSAQRTLNDAIQYITCNAENNNETGGFDQGEVVADKAELDVYYITDVELGADMEGEYDSEFTKECNIQGHPAPKIQWTKGDSTHIIDEGTLELGALTYEDAGTYTCTASNAAGDSSDSFSLKVNGPCIVSIQGVEAGSSQSVAGQASLEMACHVQGNNCEIEWETSLADEFMQQGDIEFDDGVSKLFFSSFETLSEPANFVCKATNEKGTKQDEVEIGEDQNPACCQIPSAASLGTGAIVGIVIAIPAILIIIGAAVFFCRKRNDDKNSDTLEEGDDADEPEKQPLQADHDGEGGNADAV